MPLLFINPVLKTVTEQNSGKQFIGFFLIDENPELIKGRRIAKYFSNYGIFQPNTLTLRGTVPDPNQVTPIGLNGVLEMIDWVSDITIDIPKRDNPVEVQGL